MGVKYGSKGYTLMKRCGIGLIEIILFIVLLLSSVEVAQKSVSYAAFSNPVEIKGRHIVENDETIISGRHIFVLTSYDGAPMPGGSSANVKKVSINSNETFSFGPIEYEKPGIYGYEVSREISDTKNLIQDDSVYRCIVEVTSDGTAVVIFEKNGTEGKPNSIVYTDRYKENGEKGQNVRTGDENRLSVRIAGTASLLLILGVMSIDRLGSKKKQSSSKQVK